MYGTALKEGWRRSKGPEGTIRQIQKPINSERKPNKLKLKSKKQ